MIDRRKAQSMHHVHKAHGFWLQIKYGVLKTIFLTGLNGTFMHVVGSQHRLLHDLPCVSTIVCMSNHVYRSDVELHVVRAIRHIAHHSICQKSEDAAQMGQAQSLTIRE